MLTLGAAGGEDYLEGRMDALLPLWPTFEGQGLLLGDLRAAFADEGEQEFNAGLAYRHYLDRCNAILGGNIFYDSRWTSDDNQFNQLGLGAEMLSTWVDARVNFYLPENEKNLVGTEEETYLVSKKSRTTYDDYAEGHEIRETARTVQTSRYRTDRYDIYDVPREGWDAEIGVKLPFPERWSDYETRLFIGYYDFEPTWKGNASDNDVSGVKARFEFRAWNCLFLDAEWFEDEDLYGTDYLLGARLRLPLGCQEFKALTQGDAYAWRGDGEGPVAVPERMFDMIMRDPQIQVRNELELTQTFTTKTKRYTDDYALLRDVIFVYGDNVGDLAEDGSAEHPFDVVQEGVDESAARDYPNVYVFGASRPYRENVLVGESINLHGEGCPVGRGDPPSHGYGRPVIEGQCGPALLTPAVLEIADADLVQVRGFEFTAAPFAGGPWTSPFGGGTLAPLAGIYAHDVRDLTVGCNIFRNLAAGVVSTYGPVADFDLAVVNNQFRNVGLGIGAMTDVGGRAVIAGNDIQGALLGIGFLGMEMTGRAEVDIVGNRITGRTVDLAGIEPFELFSDLFTDVLPPSPGFPADHPGTLPFPTLGGIVVVAAQGADIGARVNGNLVQHPAIGIAGLALGLGTDLTTLDFEVRGNELTGGGLDSLYQIALAHAGTLAALITGNYGVWDETYTETVGDTLRDALPGSLGFDAGLLGVGAVAVGDMAVMNHTVIADNLVQDYLIGIGAAAGGGASMDGAVVSGNLMQNNLAGILGVAVSDASMQNIRIAGNTVIGAPGLGCVNPLLQDFGLTLFGPDPVQLPEIGLAGIGLLGIGDANIDGFAITGNSVNDYLLGIGVAAVYDTDARDGVIANNQLQRNLLGIAGLSLYGGNLSRLEIGGNSIVGGGTLSTVNGVLGGLLDPVGAYDPGISGIALVSVDALARDFDIHDNTLRQQAVGIGVVGVDANMNRGRIAGNQVNQALVGILGLAIDADMQNLEIVGNRVQGGGVIPLASLLADDPSALPAGDAGVLGIGLIGINSDLDNFTIADNTVRNEVLGVAFGGMDSDARNGSVDDNVVQGNLVGILGLAVDANMRYLSISGNTVSGAGLPGTLDLVEAVVPSLLPTEITDMALPDWGVLGIGLVGTDGANVDDFTILDNRVSRNVAGIAVVGVSDANMRDGEIAANTVSDNLLGITAVAISDAKLNRLQVNNNTLTGSGLGYVDPLLEGAPVPLSLQNVGIAGISLMAFGDGKIVDAAVEGNTVSDYLAGTLGVAYGSDTSLRGLYVGDNDIANCGIGVFLAGIDGANLRDVYVFRNDISDSLVGVLATASREDDSAPRTAMTVTIENNTIRGDDALLVDSFTALSLISDISGHGFYGIPAELLGANQLLFNPDDMPTVYPGLNNILQPGGYDPLNPPSLGDIVENPNFDQLLNGQGLAGVLVHFDSAADVSSATIIENNIGDMENGMYIVVTDDEPSAQVVDIVATDNFSQDNFVIGDDLTRSDYTLTDSGANQEDFVEIPTP
ncbi:MAG: inverse autotransporter beta domain-containing protein [Kiritimatiellae bacterium]|nr:inverse autotransporter beta domain-containing protein [Kiritimatiellia bacterium]